MSQTHEVISAFLDDEFFDAAELAEALGDPTGRAVLIDLIALRHLTQPEGTAIAAIPRRTAWPNPVRRVMAAAALLVALVSGYLVGQQRSSEPSAPAAPAPTRIVEVQTAWQDVVPGRMQ